MRGGEDVLGCEPVVGHDHAGLELLRQHGPVEVIVVERGRHEAAAVTMEDDAVAAGSASVLVPGTAHPAELNLGHADVRGQRVTVERRHHCPHGPVVGVRVGEVARDEREDLGQLLAGHPAQPNS